MSPSEDLSSWSIAIELPFSATASNPTGLFRYRYEIVPQNGHTIPEGNLDRSEQVLRTHYYHFFRGNFRIQRFRGWIAPLSKDLFQYFCRQIISEDRTNFDQIFQKFSNLLICFPEAHRSQIESMFEESIQVIYVKSCLTKTGNPASPIDALNCISRIYRFFLLLHLLSH